ncbi:hypothetical protein SCAB_62751 [Streptomyces scabiei 87.22]|uniref:Uncharacterized protein n=1 Tax=Streptomyces scabiei (strain 87.22) TaxID=680198 RepID=C9ZC93_STRSW|nr:hypothetical protein SCAB_62751 [Streptomyces scabiei 87.22]
MTVLTDTNVDSDIVREPGGNGILDRGGTFLQLRNYVRSAGRTTTTPSTACAPRPSRIRSTCPRTR